MRQKIKSVLKGLAFGLTFGAFLLLGYIAGTGGLDGVESRWFPVASATTGKVIKLDDKEICWRIEFVRYRPKLKVRFFSWIMVLPNGNRIYLSQRTFGGKKQFETNVADRVKGPTVRAFCSDRPAGDITGFRLRAVGEYLPEHGLWPIRRTIKPFN